MEKYRVGIVGATGMVGQRFISLLKDHPWFEVNCVAASARSAGKTYREAVGERWAFAWEIPEKVAGMTVVDAADIDEVSKHVDFVFCAVDMKKDEIRALEEAYAKHEIPVVSNNSACRGIEDVPMVVPEINADHLAVIEAQKKRLGTKNGFIAVKPNCSIQSYVPALTPLLDFEPEKVSVCTYQAISGAGKTFKDWPEMVGNIIPFISGEEAKSEKEPLKVFGHVDAAKGMVAWAKENGTFTCSDDILACAKDADVVYTDVWASMGQEEEKAEREKIFKNYQINDEVMAAAKPDAMVLHCLPAHREEEITAKVFEAHANEIFDEAENRLHAQKAVLVKLLG